MGKEFEFYTHLSKEDKKWPLSTWKNVIREMQIKNHEISLPIHLSYNFLKKGEKQIIAIVGKDLEELEAL